RAERIVAVLGELDDIEAVNAAVGEELAGGAEPLLVPGAGLRSAGEALVRALYADDGLAVLPEVADVGREDVGGRVGVEGGGNLALRADALDEPPARIVRGTGAVRQVGEDV